ncbi:MAG TPA: DUF1330 domain-containing protein [Burkholderiales bacterium]
MPAYVIAQINVTDPEKYQEYAKLAGPANVKYGGKFLVRGGKKTVLEGNIPYERIVINEFPDVEAAKRFYNSVEYQAARQKRLGAADFNMMVVEGA